MVTIKTGNLGAGFKDFQNKVEEYWEKNQEWVLIPSIIIAAILIISFILVLLTGRDAGFLIQASAILLLIGCVVGGFYSGPYVNPYFDGMFQKLDELNSAIADKMHK